MTNPTMEPEYTGETIATFIVVPIILGTTLAAAGLFFYAWRQLRTRDHEDTPWALASWVLAVVIAAATVGLTWWGMYPWRAEYHQWTPKAGIVDTVDSRLVPESQTVQQKFVVAFVGDPQQYGVTDTRAAGMRAGDRLTITCVRRWQWSGSDGFDCNFVALERVR